MVCFGMKLESGGPDWANDEALVSDFCKATNDNMKREGAQMSLIGSRYFIYIGRDLYVFVADLLLPNVGLWSLPIAGICLMFGFPWWTYLFPAFFLLSGVVHTGAFYFFLAKLRLRIMGFKGSIKLVGADKVMLEVFDLWGKKKSMSS